MVAFLLLLLSVFAPPSRLTSGSGCSKALTTSSRFMGVQARSSNGATLEFRRNGVATSSYTPGETLTIHISGASSYAIEVTGATGTGSGWGCNTRTTSNGQTLQMPNSGTVTAKAAWGGRSQVYITSTLSISPSASDPCDGVVCSALSQCHNVGTCSNGVCSNPFKSSGDSCNDGNSATVDDACNGAGTCVGKDPCNGVVCSAISQCHNVGTCSGGVCSNPFKAAGTSCDDNDSATVDDTCNGAGSCVGNDPCDGVVCSAISQCHNVGTCSGGVCSNPFKTAGTSCDDNDAATVDDTCNGAGSCVGNDPCDGVICVALSQCHDVGTCSEGTCTNPFKVSGTSCDDGDTATVDDACNGTGTCVGRDPCAGVVCSALSQCHDVGTCSGGVCSNPFKPSGTVCSDGDSTTFGDTCNGAGDCVGEAISCDASDCNNHGTASVSGNSCACSCDSGWTGATCTIHCNRDACNNNGDASVSGNSCACSCDQGWEGSTCQTRTTTKSPTASPSVHPTRNPTMLPSSFPSFHPTSVPSKTPSTNPSRNPTSNPTSHPSMSPTGNPSTSPTSNPTNENSQTNNATSPPTLCPTRYPTVTPSTNPTQTPSTVPTFQPSMNPTSHPSKCPTNEIAESTNATSPPTLFPTTSPTVTPSTNPSTVPTFQPSMIPTSHPSKCPINENAESTPVSNPPSLFPTASPSINPTSTPISENAQSDLATDSPTLLPTVNPTQMPTNNPTSHPSTHPSCDPTSNPSGVPSLHPSGHPTHSPTATPTAQPSLNPTTCPSLFPSSHPSNLPTPDPSTNPSHFPSVDPTFTPSKNPTSHPSLSPSLSPTMPTLNPTKSPTMNPTFTPTQAPFDCRIFACGSGNELDCTTSGDHCRWQENECFLAGPCFSEQSWGCFDSTDSLSWPYQLPASYSDCADSCSQCVDDFIDTGDCLQFLKQTFTDSLPVSCSEQCRSQIQYHCFLDSSPTICPTVNPTFNPTVEPSVSPSFNPTVSPTVDPSVNPSMNPTFMPSSTPTFNPSSNPTFNPSSTPSTDPTTHPTFAPTFPMASCVYCSTDIYREDVPFTGQCVASLNTLGVSSCQQYLGGFSLWKFYNSTHCVIREMTTSRSYCDSQNGAFSSVSCHTQYRSMMIHNALHNEPCNEQFFSAIFQSRGCCAPPPTLTPTTSTPTLLPSKLILPESACLGCISKFRAVDGCNKDLESTIPHGCQGCSNALASFCSTSPSESPSTSIPTKVPSTPTPTSTGTPTPDPTVSTPTVTPSKSPSSTIPSEFPSTTEPTKSPTFSVPTVAPSDSPVTSIPSLSPTTNFPSTKPSKNPSETPCVCPSGTTRDESRDNACICLNDSSPGSACASTYRDYKEYSDLDLCTDVITEVSFPGSYTEVVGPNKQTFLEECTAKLNSESTQCVDVYDGSIIVVLLSQTDTNLDTAVALLDSDGLDLPSFPKVVPSCDSARHCSGHGSTTDMDSTDGCICECDEGWYDADCGAQLCDSVLGVQCINDCEDLVQCFFPGCGNVTESCTGDGMHSWCTANCESRMECFDDWEETRDSCSAGMEFNVIVTISGIAESQTAQIAVENDGALAGTVELSEHQTTGIIPQTFVYNSTYLAYVMITPTGHECVISNPSGTVYNHIIVYVECSFSRTIVRGRVVNLDESIPGLDMQLELSLENGESDVLDVNGNSDFEFDLRAEFWREYSVEVIGQPNEHYCNVSHPTVVIASDVTEVLVTCFEHPRCERDAHCSGNGDTTDDFKFNGCDCVCDEGWGSPDCSTVKCNADTDCNGRGTTVDEDNSDGCDCFCHLWTGPDCSIAPPCNNVQHCNAHGTTTDLDATDGCICDCDPDWSGADDCSVPICKAEVHCDDNGVTTDMNALDGCVCDCFDGFSSDPTSEIQCTIPPVCEWYTDCNNRGETNDLDRTDGCECDCHLGWSSDPDSVIQCTIPPVCTAADCFFQGSTVDPDRTDGCDCTCDQGWDPATQCELPLPCTPADFDCANGLMEDLDMTDGCVCTCDEGWWPGDNCNTQSCDRDLHCNGNGNSTDPDPTDGCECECDRDWSFAADCSVYCPYHCTDELIGDGFCDDGAIDGDDPTNYPDCRTCPNFYGFLDDGFWAFDGGDCVTSSPTHMPSQAPILEFPPEYYVLYITFTGGDSALAALEVNRTVIVDRLEVAYEVAVLYWVSNVQRLEDGVKTVEMTLASPTQMSTALLRMSELTRQIKATQAVESFGLSSVLVVLEDISTTVSPTKAPTLTSTSVADSSSTANYSSSEQFFAENWLWVVIAVAAIMCLVLYYAFTRKAKEAPALPHAMPPPPVTTNKTPFAPGPSPATWQNQMTPGYDNFQRNLYANRYEKLGRRTVPPAIQFPSTTEVQGEPSSFPDFRVGESVKFREPPAYHWVYGTVFNSVEKEGGLFYWVEYETPGGINRRRLVLQENLTKDTDRNDLLRETQETPGEIYKPPDQIQRIMPSPPGTSALSHAGYRVGDRVQVYSKSRRQWFKAEVCQLLVEGKMLVRYRMNNFLFEKKIKSEDENAVRPDVHDHEEFHE